MTRPRPDGDAAGENGSPSDPQQAADDERPDAGRDSTRPGASDASPEPAAPGRSLEDVLALVYRAPVALTSEDVRLRSGLEQERIRQVWRAMGYADVGEAAAFTESDLQALMTLKRLADRLGLTFEETLDVVRSIGQTTSRLADWQVETFGRIMARQAERAAGQPGTQTSVGESASANVSEMVSGHEPTDAERLASLDPQSIMDRAYAISGSALDELGELIDYAWRRNIGAALQRNLDIVALTGEGEVESTVGFADLVGYTRLSRQLPDRELAALVQHFDASAADAVASTGARLLKTIGDEVMFVGSTAKQAADTALALHRANPGGDEAPQLRIGLATGPVVNRMGDVYGSTVNRAARLTVLASPGATLVDDATRGALFKARSSSAKRTYSTAPFSSATLPGLGPTVAWSMTADS